MRNEVHPVVFAPEELTDDISAMERKEMERWAFTTLQLVMGENVISEISGETTAKDIWTKLEKLYLKKSLTNRLILLKMFFTMRMREGTSVKAHLDVKAGLLSEDLKDQMKGLSEGRGGSSTEALLAGMEKKKKIKSRDRK